MYWNDYKPTAGGIASVFSKDGRKNYAWPAGKIPVFVALRGFYVLPT